MDRSRRAACHAALLAVAAASAAAALAQATAPRTGIVVMHGAGARSSAMQVFAGRLRDAGHLVANLDMPWSEEEAHRVPVAAAEQRVLRGLDDLRRRGAQRLVLCGFSKGGLFAAYMATRTRVDALVAIAPNGGADQKPLQDEVARARALVAAGLGAQPTLLHDAAVTGDIRYPLPDAVPAAWLTWFDPDGPLHTGRIFAALPAGMPVLLIVPRRDLENLVRMKQALWEGLPPHPRHALAEPPTDHLGAVVHSTDGILRWLSAL